MREKGQLTVPYEIISVKCRRHEENIKYYYSTTVIIATGMINQWMLKLVKEVMKKKDTYIALNYLLTNVY